MTTVEELVKKRKHYENKMTVIENQVNAAVSGTPTRPEAEDIKRQLDDWLGNLDAIAMEITEMVADDTETNGIHLNAYYKLCTRRTTALRKLMSLSVMDVPEVKSQPSSSGHQSTVKLPTLSLPSFDGNLDDWLHFHDVYVNTVHNESNLVAVNKMKYLTSCLKGEALSLIKNIPLSANGYSEAWKLLLKRYQNKKRLIKIQIYKMLKLTPVTTGNTAALTTLADTIQGCLDSLTLLQGDVSKFDLVFLCLAEEALDADTSQAWEMMEVEGTDRTLKELIEFIYKRANSFKAQMKPQKASKPPPTTGQTRGNGRSTASHHASTDGRPQPKQGSCSVCQGEHWTMNCGQLTGVPVAQRKTLLSNKQLCFNCLNKGHKVKECRSQYTCKKCRGKHHTILHEDSGAAPSSQQQQQQPVPSVAAQPHSSQQTYFSSGTADHREKLLSTAIIKIRGADGAFQKFRALIDNGSEASFISGKCIQQLGLLPHHTSVSVSGVSGSSVGTFNKAITLELGSIYDGLFTATCEAYVLPRVTRSLPSNSFHNSWPHIQRLSNLADPLFYQSASVDLLLGVDVYASILKEGITRGNSSELPIAVNSALGWLICGQLKSGSKLNSITSHHVCVDLDQQLQKFWELEEIPSSTRMSLEEQACEDHFVSTHRFKEGRFTIRLPFNSKKSLLGSSRHLALQRFLHGKRRLQKQPSLQQQYVDFMEEYEKLGHMRQVPSSALMLPDSMCYYIPHHIIQNPNSTTTKARVVFDCSMKTSTGTSLNDILLNGKLPQNPLMSILLRFRTHLIVLTGDVEKMYRQILIHPEDQPFQRIFWRSNKDAPIKEYQLLTVTYGCKSAPHGTTRALHQHAENLKKEFPEAARMIQEDCYVDDLMLGTSTAEEAITLRKNIQDMLMQGGLPIRKWSSNNIDVLNSIPAALRATQVPLPINSDDSVKALGLHWHPGQDYFTYSVTMSYDQEPSSKRSILSAIARLYDPLGTVTPVVINGKRILQELWKLAVGWDEEIPSNTEKDWTSYKEDLLELNSIQIQRCILPPQASQLQLHGFSDASERAYAACIYIRSYANGTFHSSLLCAKSRVSPVKEISIPKLELCGALLLAKLVKTVLGALNLQFEAVHAWTDSTVVLAWLNPNRSRWSTFVSNRVTKITELIKSEYWHHVPGAENPADCASRGIRTQELKRHTLWWTGPPWLQQAAYTIPEVAFPLDVPEKKQVLPSHHVKIEDTLLHKVSSLTKLLNITVFWWRFLRHKALKDHNIKGAVTAEEKQLALFHWIRLAQQMAYPHELHAFKTGSFNHGKSKLSKLDPYLEQQTGLIRVGGRLRHSALRHEQKHPIILPQTHPLTSLIFLDFHEKLFHAGPQLLLSSLRQQFWLVNGQDVVRRFCRQCLDCYKQRAETAQQKMGDLPAPRVTESPPFDHTGVDYAGPIKLHTGVGRNPKTVSGWVAIFVCFSTRAIHLECVTSLTTDEFLAALKRFIARRGKCSVLYSDNGTNFVGAANQFKEWGLFLSPQHNDRVTQVLAEDGISWRFNPPGALHVGGLWEAGVKSFKYHMKRVVKDNCYTFEEMTTFLSQTEACLNSRPLSAMSSDPSDFRVLTPGHFLVGRPLTALPEPDLTSEAPNRLVKWQRVQQNLQSLWRRWYEEHLTRLQQRPKWAGERENLRLGDLALIKRERMPPTQWKMGRIIKLHPGADSLVRFVDLKTGPRPGQDEKQQCVSKLSPLPYSWQPVQDTSSDH